MIACNVKKTARLIGTDIAKVFAAVVGFGLLWWLNGEIGIWIWGLFDGSPIVFERTYGGISSISAEANRQIAVFSLGFVGLHLEAAVASYVYLACERAGP
jgi:hypothetical protein